MIHERGSWVPFFLILVLWSMQYITLGFLIVDITSEHWHGDDTSIPRRMCSTITLSTD